MRFEVPFSTLKHTSVTFFLSPKLSLQPPPASLPTQLSSSLRLRSLLLPSYIAVSLPQFAAPPSVRMQRRCCHDAVEASGLASLSLSRGFTPSFQSPFLFSLSHCSTAVSLGCCCRQPVATAGIAASALSEFHQPAASISASRLCRRCLGEILRHHSCCLS